MDRIVPSCLRRIEHELFINHIFLIRNSYMVILPENVTEKCLRTLVYHFCYNLIYQYRIRTENSLQESLPVFELSQKIGHSFKKNITCCWSKVGIGLKQVSDKLFESGRVWTSNRSELTTHYFLHEGRQIFSFKCFLMDSN